MSRKYACDCRLSDNISTSDCGSAQNVHQSMIDSDHALDLRCPGDTYLEQITPAGSPSSSDHAPAADLMDVPVSLSPTDELPHDSNIVLDLSQPKYCEDISPSASCTNDSFHIEQAQTFPARNTIYYRSLQIRQKLPRIDDVRNWCAQQNPSSVFVCQCQTQIPTPQRAHERVFYNQSCSCQGNVDLRCFTDINKVREDFSNGNDFHKTARNVPYKKSLIQRFRRFERSYDVGKMSKLGASSPTSATTVSTLGGSAASARYVNIASVLASPYAYMYNHQLSKQQCDQHELQERIRPRTSYANNFDFTMPKTSFKFNTENQFSYSTDSSHIRAHQINYESQLAPMSDNFDDVTHNSASIEMARLHLEQIVEMRTMLAAAASATKARKHNLLGHHPASDVLFVKCNECGVTYGNHRRFRRHFIEHHGGNEPHRRHVTIYTISASRAANALGEGRSSRTYVSNSSEFAPMPSNFDFLSRRDSSYVTRGSPETVEVSGRVVKAKLFDKIPVACDVMNTDAFHFNHITGGSLI